MNQRCLISLSSQAKPSWEAISHLGVADIHAQWACMHCTSSKADLRHAAFFLLRLPTGGRPGAYRQVAYWLAQKGEGGEAGPEVPQQAGYDAAKSGDVQ